MGRYRIGNDMTILWTVNDRDGKALPLKDKEVHLYYTCERGRFEANFEIQGTNVVAWNFLGKNQRALGDYTLSLEILQSDGKRTIKMDKCNAFSLVGRNCEELYDNADADINEGGELTIVSNLDIYRISPIIPYVVKDNNGIGYWYVDGVETGDRSTGESAYEYALTKGFDGTEEEFAALTAKLPNVSAELAKLSAEITEKRYTEGGILNYDTKFVARDGYSYTDFIKVEPTKNYIINFGEITSTAYIIEYDASHNKVDHWALLVGTTSYNLTMNAATEYIRFSFMTDNVDDAYVTYGNDVIWEAYVSRITDLENIAKANTALLDELKNTSSQILLQDSTKLLSDNIRNCIKAVWISCQTKGNVEKLLEQLHALYIAEITNKPSNYSPYVSLSQRVDSDDSSFVWYLTAQTEPRHGVEVISARISTALFNSLGLNGFYPYINIEIDWDAFGQNVSVMNTGISLSLKDTYRYHAERVSLTDCGSSIVNQSLVGKTIVFFGDSITEMTDNENSLRYSDYMAYFSGAKAINVGIGGTQLRQRTTPALAPSSSNQAYAALDIINVIKASCDRDFSMQIAASAYLNDAVAQVETLQGIDWTKVDGVVIFAGTNDWGVQNALGESGSADVNKTLGAVNEIIRLLLSTYPHLTLYWFTPIIRWVDYSNGVGDANKWSDIMDVEGNGTLKAMSHAIAEEVALHHIPICDMYNTLGWNKYNFGRYFLPTDGTHPKTTEGTMYIAKKMLSFILANNTL